MRIIWLWCFVLCTLIGTAAMSGEMPVADLTLHEGDNTITLTLKNAWNRDIRNLTVRLGEETTPAWVRLSGSDEPVTIMAGENGECLLSFTISVTSAPATDYASLPVVLADDAGNLWTVLFSVSTGTAGDTPLVFDTALTANYPNPFNPKTTIPYSLAESAQVEMTIYNILGQRIRTLLDGHQSPGAYSVVWDGRDEQGRSVSSGVYLCRFRAGGFSSVQRMMLIE